MARIGYVEITTHLIETEFLPLGSRIIGVEISPDKRVTRFLVESRDMRRTGKGDWIPEYRVTASRVEAHYDEVTDG